MSDILTETLMGGSALMVVASVGFFGFGIYQNYFSQFVAEVQDESAGGMSGMGSVAIRKLGAMNRRIMWPGYESKMRRKLIKAGEPQAFKPEDIMALQEVSAVIGLLMGLILVNFVGENLAWSLLFALFGMYYPLIWVNDQVKKRHLQISRALPYLSLIHI